MFWGCGLQEKQYVFLVVMMMLIDVNVVNIEFEDIEDVDDSWLPVRDV